MTSKCILVKRGSKGQCVCAKRISYAEAQSLGIDWAKIPSFAELCQKQGITKIMVGSTITDVSKVLQKKERKKNKYKPLGGDNMEERYDLIEGCCGGVTSLGQEDLIDLGALRDFIPGIEELKSLGKGVGGGVGSIVLSRYVVDRFITPDKWLLNSLVKLALGLFGSKVLVKYVDPAVGVGFGIVTAVEAIQSLIFGYRAAQATKQAAAEQQAQTGYLSPYREQYLSGTEVYEYPEETRDIGAIYNVEEEYI